MFETLDLREQRDSWTKLEDVGEIVGGSTPKTGDTSLWNGNNYWITPAEIKEDAFYINSTERTLTDKGVKSCSLRQLPINTVILSSRAPIGKVAIAGTEMYCNQGFKNVICNKDINPIFLYTLFKNNTEFLNSLGKGATFKEISKSIASKIRVPLPPIDLQNKFADFVKHIDKLKYSDEFVEVVAW